MTASLRGIAVLITSTALLVAAEGIPPRSSPTDYPHLADVGGIGIGVALLTPQEVQRAFVSGIGGEYLVLEVAVYPKAGEQIELDRRAFNLRIPGDDRVLVAENPKVIAGGLSQKSSSNRDVVVIPQAQVGYESGGPTYDPTTGATYPGYRRKGWYYSTGVGVLVGQPAPGPNPKNRDVMELELTEKGLPSGSVSTPVAGHLYFRVGHDNLKNRNARYVLEFTLGGRTGSLSLAR